MPLKPIFDKAPLTAMSRQPLRAGLVRSDCPRLNALYAIVKRAAAPAELEGAFRLACIVTAKPGEEPIAERIRAALHAQQEDGSFALSIRDSVAVLRAAWVMYEYEARKPILEHIARWCAWAAANWDDVMADDAVWAAPADLMELLENLYRVTGKAAVLTLCERVATQTMLWSGVLNTQVTQRPTGKDVTRDELLSGLANEGSSREGYYTRYVRVNHPESLADGARAAMMKGLYTGSATELNTSRNGWEKLYRHHGAICGGLTSDELLEGTSPAGAVSTAALGAWAEAFVSAAMGDRADWAWDALERMIYNALPACMADGAILPFQRVNTLTAEHDEQDFLYVTEDHADRAITRLARGYAALSSSVVTVTPGGASVNLYHLPGRFAVMVNDDVLVLHIAPSSKNVTITVHCKKDVKAALTLRVPAWSRNTEVTLNGAELGDESDTADLRLERVWHDGDAICVSMEQAVRVADGHHQGKYVLKGPMVLALDAADGSWQKAFVDLHVEDGRVAATLDAVPDWKRRGDVPADIPVLPVTAGTPALSALKPYAKATKRIALFPGRKQA